MRSFVQVCARRLVELAALPPRAQVLDIATGTGWAAMAAAQHVGPTGRVLGVDLAPELLERARQKVTAVGLTQVEFRAGDAERLDLADQCFDVVLCASALFFVPDMLAALREWHRVLKPGGQVGFSGLGRPPCSPCGTCGMRACGSMGVSVPTASPEPAPGRAGDVSAVTARGRLCADLVQSEQLGYYFRTVEEYWEEMWSSRAPRGLSYSWPPPSVSSFRPSISPKCRRWPPTKGSGETWPSISPVAGNAQHRGGSQRVARRPSHIPRRTSACG